MGQFTYIRWILKFLHDSKYRLLVSTVEPQSCRLHGGDFPSMLASRWLSMRAEAKVLVRASWCIATYLHCSGPKQGDSTIDPEILRSLSQGSPERYPSVWMFAKPPHRAAAGQVSVKLSLLAGSNCCDGLPWQ